MKFLFDYNSKNTEHVPDASAVNLPAHLLRTELNIPDINEVDVIRHFMALSKKNYGVDNGFYPLGSCTMKYNPKINEDVARFEGFANLHPLSPEPTVQGSLQLMHELQQYLCEITGMDAFSLQPAAGAHGELTCLMIAKVHFKGKRHTVVLPDSAHGTNPASAAMCGFNVVEVKTDSNGNVDLEQLKQAMNEDVAVFMLTNPNTLGLFDQHIKQIADIVHKAGALMYCDGANMNAMLGITRPGDQGFDMLHLNLHKTFSTPHGGGGPGAGPIGVKKFLEKYLPIPRIIKKTEKSEKGEKGEIYAYDYNNYPESIGRVRPFYGNFGMLVRAYAYIRSYGPKLKEVAEIAVLNANYIMHALKDAYGWPYKRTCAHECVLSGEKFTKNSIHTLDIAKRLLDYGFHSPTIYFPLIVPEAIMIEPTETESKATLDAFIQAMLKIADEAEKQPELLHNAPTSTPVGRLDGVLAARKPNLKWTPSCSIC